jgi:TRAP-type C4-dicarboxylate transport system substrate-binding protein
MEITMKFLNLAVSAVALAAVALPASAATTLRIQTHQGADSPAGQLYKIWEDDVETMSNGSLDIEMF